MKFHWCFLTFVLFCFFCGCNTTLALERFETISTVEMKQLLDKREGGNADFVLVNTLDEIVYNHSSIPGSVNIPWYKAEEYQSKLGEIKNKLIITYCKGHGSVNAYKAAVAVKKMGYENIKIYGGGLEDWVKSGHKVKAFEPLPEYEVQFITAEQLLQDLQKAESGGCRDWRGNPKITILDLRTANFLEAKFPIFKIKTGCLTIKMLFDQLADAKYRKNIPKKGRVVTVTETGDRDADAIRYLFKHGYSNVVGLKSGIQDWIRLDFSRKHGK